MAEWRKIVSSPSTGFTMGVGSTMIWEGHGIDNYETMLTAGTVTQDNTLTLPNITGTLATTENITDELSNSSLNWKTGGNTEFGNNAFSQHKVKGMLYITEVSGTPSVFGFHQKSQNGSSLDSIVNILMPTVNNALGTVNVSLPLRTCTLAGTDEIPALIDDDTFTTGVTSSSVASSESIKAYTDNLFNNFSVTNANSVIIDGDSTNTRFRLSADNTGGNFVQNLKSAALTNSSTILLPDANGTVALTSQLPSSNQIIDWTNSTESFSTSGSISTTDVIIGDTIIATDSAADAANSVTINSQNGGEITFEGSTADGNQTILRAEESTGGSRVLSLPDSNGTLTTSAYVNAQTWLNIVSDSTPELGGHLSLNSMDITDIDGTEMYWNGESTSDRMFTLKVLNSGLGQGIIKIQADKLNLIGSLESTGGASLVKDENDMVSDSDVHIPTQQSVKKYVDDHITFCLNTYFVFASTISGRTFFRDADAVNNGHKWSAIDAEDTTTIGDTISIQGHSSVSGIAIPKKSKLIRANWTGWQSENNNNEVILQIWTGTPTNNQATTNTTITLRDTITLTNYNQKGFNFLTPSLSVGLDAGDMIYPAFQYVSGTAIELVGNIAFDLVEY